MQPAPSCASVEFAQVHATVERRDLVGVAIEWQRRTLSEFAETPLLGLAPARVIDCRVHVCIETVLTRRGLAPAGGRLLLGETDTHDRLAALQPVLPRHHQPQRGAGLIRQGGAARAA